MTSLARAKHTSLERQIAKELGISDAQLDALLRIRAGYWPGNAAAILEAKGFAERAAEGRGRLTESGEALLRRARAMGF